MKITKAKNGFKKIFLMPILVLLILIGSINFGCSGQEQANISSYNAPEEKKALYEVDVFYNIVILTNLSDKSFSSTDYITIDKAFNDLSDPNVKSLREYFREESKYRKDKNGTPSNPLDVISVYMFCDSTISQQAFKDLDKDDPNNTRQEQLAFVKSALNGKIYRDINQGNEFNGDLDANNDGLIDSITLYVPLSITDKDFDTTAWPHTILGNGPFSHTFRLLKYDRFVVSSYTIHETSAQVGVMCHEMLHNIGNNAPDNGVQDLYHYPNKSDPGFDNKVPVGNYCIMAATDYNNPQPLNMYYKSKLGWAELVEITGNKKIDPIPLTAAKAIKFGEKDSEFFIAQYWPANNYNRFSSHSNNFSREAGVIIYRVNSAITRGNMGGGNKDDQRPEDKMDEICVFSLTLGFEQGNSYDIPAVLKNETVLRNLLTYSDGSPASLTVKISINTDSFNIAVECYNVEFKVLNAVTNVWEIVPYEIAILTGKTLKEETFGGIYVFSLEKDYNVGKTISFECYGYKFYLEDPNITGGLNDIQEIPLSDTPYYKLDENNFTITIYAVATPRDIFVNFKDFEGNILDFNLSSIDYALCEHDGTLQNEETLSLANSSGKLSNNNQVKNGDFIYFTLNGYRTEILEITPDVKTTADLRLKMLCTIEGTVSSKGTPLKNVAISIEDYIVISIDGNKYSFELITFIIYSDYNGHFKLTNIPQGSKITFAHEEYNMQSHTVTKDNLNLSIKLKGLSESSLIVIIVASIIIAVILIATLISVIATRKKHSYNTYEHYNE